MQVNDKVYLLTWLEPFWWSRRWTSSHQFSILTGASPAWYLSNVTVTGLSDPTPDTLAVRARCEYERVKKNISRTKSPKCCLATSIALEGIYCKVISPKDSFSDYGTKPLSKFKNNYIPLSPSAILLNGWNWNGNAEI